MAHPHNDHDHHDHHRAHDHHDEHEHHDDHDHATGLVGWLQQLFHVGGHSHAETSLAADDALASSEKGIRTIYTALAILLATTVLQVVIYMFSGSVALLADTVHNLGDALNTGPLLIAFRLSSRAATRRYNYGYHRAEDIAGVIIVLSIAFSAGYIFYESLDKFFNPDEIRNLWAVAIAALVGFLGNEIVARIQIQTGQEINSAALIADGQHARTDGLTSLAVLLAAGATAFGFPILDPIIGILIGVAIVFITWDTMKAVYYRLMDAIEPEYYDRAEQLIEAAIKDESGSKELQQLRLRWHGHRIMADAYLAVERTLSVEEGHHLAEHVRMAVLDAMPMMAELLVHIEPYGAAREQFHLHTIEREPLGSRFKNT